MKVVSIILAAGKSTRMRMPGQAKVCVPVLGKPAILRLLEALETAGIQRHVIVVGVQAEQVMSTVASAYENCVYAFQREQRGTGHAAKVGFSTLRLLDYDGPVLVLPGDKIIQPAALKRLVHAFEKQKADLAFMIGKKEWMPTAGRIIFSLEGQPVGSIEKFDAGRSRLLAAFFAQTDRGGVMEPDRALALAREFVGPEEKIALALGELYDMLKKGHSLSHDLLTRYFSPEDRLLSLSDGRQITGAEVEKSQWVNLSVYLIKSAVLQKALKQIRAENAQNEEYLTDIINILAQQGAKLVPVKTESEDEVMAFNTQEELQRIEERLAETEPGAGGAEAPDAKAGPESRPRVSDWQNFLAKNGRLERWLNRLFGIEKTLSEKNLFLLRTCLDRFREVFGNVPVVISRAPARINLMGRHIDHQGGPCNTLAINREIFLLARQRDDRLIRLHNLFQRQYGSHEFNLDEFDAFLHQESWDSFLNIPFVRRAIEATRGDWSHYIRGAVLRLQKQFPGRKLKGMDILVGGNIPVAAGLSSSSALLVAAALATVRVNQLPINVQDLARLCGEAEWFVGTRGGTSDHAAMLLAQREKVSLIEFDPLHVMQHVDWPEELAILVAYSGKPAEKSASARLLFNQRVACYHIALRWFERNFPELSSPFHSLRDLHPLQLQLPLAEFYRRLAMLPESLSAEQVKKQFDDIWAHFIGHHPEGELQAFPVRDVVMFGLSEMERSRRFANALMDRDFATLGRLMRISHDGDRVSAWQGSENRRFERRYGDRELQRLIELAESESDEASLYLQSGAYRCSIPEVDHIVDIAQSVPGVLGAQIAGAGLGGSAMILLQKEAIQPCARMLNQQFYKPRNLEPKLFLCYPVERAGILEMPD
ncbi:MAG: NTP transferase domain-containing protein [candidate division KSB1 bacterium]|nr:NTP transferase domain-containing protein [candidate division KSB1 bacterium]